MSDALCWKRVSDGSNSVDVDLSKLNTFVEQFKAKYYLKIGILGAKNARRGKGPSNAEVGATHEFGSFAQHIPKRSFLRMPLHEKSETIIREVGKTALALLAAGKILQVFQNIGVSCVGQIHDAFASGGFGKWPQLKYATIISKLRKRFKDIHLRRSLAGEQMNDGITHTPILVKTRQLERSITFKVESK